MTRRVSSSTTVRPLTRLSRFSMPITLAACQVCIASDLSLGVGPAAQRDHRCDGLAPGRPAGDIYGERVEPQRL